MAISTTLIASSSYAGQALLMFGFAVLLLFYYRQYKRSYLRFWSYATFYYSLGCAANFIRLVGFDFDWFSDNTLFYLKHFHISAFYVALASLVIGAVDIIRNKLPRKKVRWLIYAISIVGGVAPIFFTEPASGLEVVSYGDDAMFLITGLALLLAGIIIWLVTKAGLGPKLIAFSFIVHGLKNLGVLGALLFLSLNGLNEVVWALQGYFNMVSVVVVVLGITIWLLDSERHHALSAIQQADFLGRHDALTQLPNREELMTKLPLFIDSCRASDRQLSIVMIGADRFKAINDTLGMKGGDRVLVEISDRLKALPYRQIFQARISGDVFVIVFDHLKRLSLLQELGQNIHDRLQDTMHIDGRELSVSCSVGVSRYPQHGSRAETLVSKANIALANAKLSSNPSVMVYQRGMDEHYIRLADIEPELRRAFAQDEFFIQLQPIFSGRRQALTCFEALVRWQHPIRGLLGPGEFLPFIEQLGMISDLDDWVLARCAKLIYEWRKAGERTVPIAVNLGARQFQNNRLTSHIQKLFQQYELKATDLELEITESVAVSDMTTGLNVLSELREMGIRISIDDFGTGYSSLSYLRRLPFDRIKIDRSFVHEMLEGDSNLTIVRTLVQLSHGLRKTVIAEGVETHEQLATLLDLGCDSAQGYLLSPPVNTSEAREILKKHWKTWGEVNFSLISEK
ncbi:MULTISPECIES: bifunctional diguanylate cyclase/phosphodiesterase [Gammaproteobacteria]|uniref:putative bifunctional diguanylate cyclase/phosphodiesterase n=1 Tax=Gammaproteobacteria TaxID=1236 RepID=UPI000DD0CA13|nr:MULTISPECIES: bifunctional diguanylate cyclase/phosphodiesterase [Gammaproteobacteria]RTE85905.1 bifunctional diguanylate cyclase/phosphodiesterase [Aliidiomarina sp. B3213]TCZ90095.1 bifunctional diguanylate cyclase/phosphodiesterase [Lysobacter sp. N42]